MEFVIAKTSQGEPLKREANTFLFRESAGWIVDLTYPAVEFCQDRWRGSTYGYRVTHYYLRVVFEQCFFSEGVRFA